MNAINPEQGALERLGIPVETNPPEGILTSGTAQSIRFRISEPAGYAYPDVESFMFEYLIPSLEWYTQSLHQRDLAVHKLGEELDRIEITVVNLKAQLENKEFNDALGIAVDEGEQDEEYNALLTEYQRLQSEREEYQAAYNALLAEKERLEQELQNQQNNSVSTENMYSHEEVEGFIATAVQEALTEAQKNAPKPDAVYSEEEFQSALAAQVQLNQKASEGMYTEAEVQELLANKTAELQAIEKPTDENDRIIDVVLEDERYLAQKAKIRTLEDSLDQMEKYANELEAYQAKLEGKNPPEQEESRPLDAYGRPLPEIRPEDL